MKKNILDVCCGSRMFWFDKYNPDVIFNDIRRESHTLCDGRTLDIDPDTQMDFRKLEFKNGQFKLVIFDPPHLIKLGKNSWMAKKYGVLEKDWKEDLRKGFSECFRVLEDYGVLIFKWNERDKKISEILKLTNQKPLFGHTTGRSGNTKWICFIKGTRE